MKIDSIKVNVVSEKDLVNFLNVKLKHKEELSVEYFALWEDKYCITPDCTFWEVTDRWYNNKSNKVIDIECRVKKYNNEGGYSIRMDKSDFVCTITLKDYLALAKEVDLIEFIRYNYNPRIQANQKLLMEYINDTEILEPQE